MYVSLQMILIKLEKNLVISFFYISLIFQKKAFVSSKVSEYSFKKPYTSKAINVPKCLEPQVDLNVPTCMLLS